MLRIRASVLIIRRKDSLMEFKSQILTGDALELLKALPDETFDLIITSPPYFGLRFYGDATAKWMGGHKECFHKNTMEMKSNAWDNNQRGGKGGINSDEYANSIAVHTECLHVNTQEIRRPPGGGYDQDSSVGSNRSVRRVETFSKLCTDCGAWHGQLGLEPTSELYVGHLCEIINEAKRVLKKTGNFYLNIGDKYTKKGSLFFIPEMVALNLIKNGWFIKSKIVWFKPNHTPASKKRGLTPSYEIVYHLYKHKSFYYNLDAIRVPHQTKPTVSYKPYHGKYEALGIEGSEEIGGPRARRMRHKREEGYENQPVDGGGNKGDLHSGLTRAEVAVEVAKIKERIGDSHAGEATAHLYMPHSDYHPLGKNPGDVWDISTQSYEEARGHFAVYPLALNYRPILSSCPPDGLVCDIFAGSGTTAEAVEITNGTIVSSEDAKLKQLCPRWQPGANRKWVMMEINPKYVEIMKKRLSRYGY